MTVALAATHGPARLARSLDALQHQHPDVATEIIVAVPAGDTASCSALQEFQGRHPCLELITLDTGTSTAEGWNACLELATGTHILFLRSGEAPSPNYLRELCTVADGRNLPAAASDSRRGLPQSTRQPRFSSLADTAALLRHPGLLLLPRSWIGGARFDPQLGPLAPAVFLTGVLAPYRHRFAQVDSIPGSAGALLRGVETRPPTVEEEQRAIASLLARPELPAERAPLTLHLLRELGWRDDRIPGWPSFDQVTDHDPSSAVGPLTIVAGSASALAAVKDEIVLLAHRTRVSLVFVTGSLPEVLSALPHERLPLGPDADALTIPSPGGRSGPRIARRATTALRRVYGAGTRTASRHAPALLATPLAARSLRRTGTSPLSGTVIPLDRAGRLLAAQSPTDDHAQLALQGLVMSAATGLTPVPHHLARAVATVARRNPRLGGSPAPARVYSMIAWRLINSSRYAAAQEVLALSRARHPLAVTDAGTAMLECLLQVARAGGARPSEGETVVRETLQAVDHAMANGDHARAAALLTWSLAYLFHPDSDDAEGVPLLAATPEAVVGPLLSCRTWEALTRDSARATVTAVQGRPKLVVFRGAYPKFTGPALSAVADHADLTVVDPDEVPRSWATMGMSVPDVAARLQPAHEGPGGDDPVSALLRSADVVFADWVDKATVAVSRAASPGTRLVVRFHGVDSLSPWQFLVDWGRVTDIVFVSDHLRRAVQQLLGQRIAHCRLHTITHAVEVGRLDRPPTGAAHRRLGMVGWGQRVKDPLWTVELLARLRSRDPGWRLRLIGHDFPEKPARASEAGYAEQFRERIAAPDVCGAIEFVAHTPHLEQHLDGVGFAISSSLRESFHIGVLEMAASRAVPVIRNWPTYRGLGGARELFGDDWTVESLDEAEARILAHDDPSEWAAAAEAARNRVAARFPLAAHDRAYRRVLLGRDPEASS